MKAIKISIIVIILVIALAAPIVADQPRDVLYQIATIDSLMSGLYDGFITINQLTKHGNFGLGTFDKLNGEMVVIDGTAYQVTSDGLAHKADKAITTPFAAVTFFDRNITASIPEEMTLSKLQGYLNAMLPSKNLFYAIKIDGTFTQVKTRSVPSQNKPYPLLVDVAAKQPTFELKDIKGIIVALWCPYYVKGVNVPGYHMHFITSDRTRGGHLLDCTVKNANVAIDTTTEFYLSLPNDDSFSRTDFQTGSSGDLKKVEQGN